MTGTWTHPQRSGPATGARTRAARRASLRAELFRQFFLPAAREISPGRRRIERARAGVARFPAVNPQQAQLRCLVLRMLDYMARELSGAGDEAVLDRWWAAVRAYLQVLELPVMATPKARTLLPKIIDAPWPDVERAAAFIARKWGPAGTACPKPQN